MTKIMTTVHSKMSYDCCKLNVYISVTKILPPFLGISASGKIGVGVISRKHHILENRPMHPPNRSREHAGIFFEREIIIAKSARLQD